MPLRFFTNIKLFISLGPGFGMVLALLLSLGRFSLYTQNQLTELNRKLYEHPFAVKSAVLSLQAYIRNIQRGMHGLLDATIGSKPLAPKALTTYDTGRFKIKLASQVPAM